MDESSIESRPKWFWPLVASLSVLLILLSILILTTLNKHGKTPAIKSVEKIEDDNQKKLDPAAMKLVKQLEAEAAATKAMKERKAKAEQALREGGEIDPFNLALGQTGQIEAHTYLCISQVIDEHRMLIKSVRKWTRGGGWYETMDWQPIEGQPGGQHLVKVTKTRPSSSGTDTSSPFLVCGVPTKGIVDDMHLDKLPGVYEVTDTWTYPTAVAGTKTVFVLQRLDADLVTDKGTRH